MSSTLYTHSIQYLALTGSPVSMRETNTLSDWVLHPVLDHQAWIAVLLPIAEKLLSDPQPTFIQLSKDERYFVTHVFSLRHFQTSMTALLEKHGVRPIVLYEVEQWHAFRRHLG